MIVRILEPNEKYKASLAMAVAFEYGIDYRKEKTQALTMSRKDCEAAKALPEVPENVPALPSDSYPATLCFGSLSDDEQDLYGCMDLNTFTARFDGSPVLMGGVGGVATLPQYRRNGAIRGCMNVIFRHMYDNGYTLSFLYPFSRAYYRKFGYVNGGKYYTWTIPFDALPAAMPEGSVELLPPGESMGALLSVYNQFYETYNCSVIRREFDRRMEEQNLLEQQRYIHIWKNREGIPRGFMIAKKVDGILDCTTSFALPNAFLFLDAEALTGLLGFAKSAFSTDYRAIRFAVPENIPVDSMIFEGNKAKCTVNYNGMARIVSVESALKLCRCLGNGSLRIKVCDNILPENNAVWELVWSEDSPNQVSRCNKEADIEFPISEFSAFLCGIRSAEEIPYVPEVTVRNPKKDFSKVFYKKNNYVLNLF